jgi:choline dehydrogenase-like flavoprotein
MITILLSRKALLDDGRHAVQPMINLGPVGQDGSMAKIPASTQTSLWQRLTSHAQQRWPQISQIQTRYRAGFAYIDAVVDGHSLRLCRLRYGGSASQWGFAIYRASHDDYEDSYLPTGYPVGTAEDALDTACGLYLADPTAWT